MDAVMRRGVALAKQSAPTRHTTRSAQRFTPSSA